MCNIMYVPVGEVFVDVEDNHQHVARPGGGDDLPAAPLAVLGALDDPRQVEQLDLRALNPAATG